MLKNEHRISLHKFAEEMLELSSYNDSLTFTINMTAEDMSNPPHNRPTTDELPTINKLDTCTTR